MMIESPRAARIAIDRVAVTFELFDHQSEAVEKVTATRSHGCPWPSQTIDRSPLCGVSTSGGIGTRAVSSL